MNSMIRRGAVGATGALMLVAMLVSSSPATAAPSGAVPFGQAVFHGYANGTEVHVAALSAGGTTAVNLDQAFSGASTNTAGLTTKITNEVGSIVQPAQPASVKAYGTGSGLEVGLGTSTAAERDANQIILAGKAEQTAPPNSTAVTKQVGPVDVPSLLHAQALIGRAAAIWDPNQCPIGQPISFGLGDAANVNLLTPPGGVPVANTAGTGTSTAQSDSETFLSANGDGAFGVTSQARNIIAPVTVTIPNVGILTVTVNGATPNLPVTLDAITTGGSTGAAVRLSNAKTVTVKLVLAGTTVFNQSITLSNVLPPAITIPGVATINVDPVPHAIGGSVSSSPTVVGGTAASGAIDLLHVLVNPGGATLLNLAVGHLEASANLTAPITCSIPIIKTATPSSVTVPPAQPFVYTIQIPDPAKIALFDCDLLNFTAVDTITDLKGSPTFHITSVSNGGTITQTSPNSATVTWTGLNYHVAPHGSPPNPPVTLTINVTVPANSPAGTLLDAVNVPPKAPSNCGGGASNIPNIGNVQGTPIGGHFDLDAPSVTAVTPTPPTTAGPTASTLPAKLPFTGAIGGPWQPIAGLGVLGLGGAALALVRRSRRRLTR